MAAAGMTGIILAAVIGYLLGSIPFGLLLTRLAGLGDIRQIGSGNIGATNVLRTGNKGLAALTLLLDVGKGAAAVLIGALWGPTGGAGGGRAPLSRPHVPGLARLPRRQGRWRRRSASLLALAWPVALAAALVWLAMAVIFRYSSLAALIGAAAGGGPRRGHCRRRRARAADRAPSRCSSSCAITTTSAA